MTNNTDDKFVIVRKNMFKDARLKELSNDGIILYSFALDLLELSKKRGYIDKETGQPFVLFTWEMALNNCRISKPTFYRLKKDLKKLGIFVYEEQVSKKAGVSTPIFVIPYDIWSKNNEKSTFIQENELPDFQ